MTLVNIFKFIGIDIYVSYNYANRLPINSTIVCDTTGYLRRPELINLDSNSWVLMPNPSLIILLIVFMYLHCGNTITMRMKFSVTLCVEYFMIDDNTIKIC